MKISKFKFFHGKINGDFYRIYDTVIDQEIRRIIRNMDINTIVNLVNNTRIIYPINNT